VFTVIVRTTNYAGLGAEEPISVKARALLLTSGLPSQARGSVSSTIKFALPYTVNEISAWVDRPSTPLLDYGQNYAPGFASISPTYVSGGFPPNKLFSFSFNAQNSGAAGQNIDFSALFAADIPSLKVYYRWYGGTYYYYTSYYVFEDWVRVIRAFK